MAAFVGVRDEGHVHVVDLVEPAHTLQRRHRRCRLARQLGQLGQKAETVVTSAATDKATRLKSAEAVISGKTVDDKLLQDAGEAALGDCEFIADVRGSVPYKRELMKVNVRRAIRSASAGDMP